MLRDIADGLIWCGQVMYDCNLELLLYMWDVPVQPICQWPYLIVISTNARDFESSGGISGERCVFK
jgi:hypothetical protein